MLMMLLINDFKDQKLFIEVQYFIVISVQYFLINFEFPVRYFTG